MTRAEGAARVANPEPASAKNARGWARRAQAIWPWLAAALTGFLAALPFPRWDHGWAVWICLVPLLAAVWFSKGTAWRNARLGYLAGMLFFSINFGWLGSLGELAGTPALRLIPVLLACYMALYFAFWAWLAGRLLPAGYDFRSSRTNLWLALLCACAWVAHEWVRGWLFSGFGWNGLGIALHRKLALIQIAEWTGVGGLSFVIVFLNVVAAATLRRFVSEVRRARLRPHWDFSIAMTLLVAVFAFGVRALQKHDASRPLNVAAVQANIPQNEKWQAEFETKIYDRYRDLTRFAATLKPDLIVWPEASMPSSYFVQPSFDFVNQLAAETDSNVLLGSVDFDVEGEQQLDFNAAILVSGAAGESQTYRKNHLVPFGEYIPFRNSFPLFAMIVGDLVPGDFRSGNAFTLLSLREGKAKLAPLICFEDTVGELARKFVLAGAEVLVNITNDGWFLRSPAAEQHLANAVFRAVETRRPLIRAANTGVTCFVDPHGRVTHSLRGANGDTFIEGVLAGRIDVPVAGRLTFYTRHGEVFSMLCAAVTVGTVGWTLRKRRAA